MYKFGNMEQTESKIKELIDDICQQKNVYLLGLDISGGGRNRQVKIIVDTESGVTLKECQQISKEVNDIFFRKDIYADGYKLEVSSPGVDKPLEHEFEFRKNVGRDLALEYIEGDEILKVTGTLESFSGEQLCLIVGKDSVVVPRANVKHAKVKLKW